MSTKMIRCNFCERRFNRSTRKATGSSADLTMCEDCEDDLRDVLEGESQLEDDELNTLLLSRSKEGGHDDERYVDPLGAKKCHKLKRQMKELNETIQRAKSIDCHETINLHCDNLKMQVIETVESAIKHLNRIQNEYLKEIDAYRRKLQDALWSDRFSSQIFVNKSIRKLGELEKELAGYKATSFQSLGSRIVGQEFEKGLELLKELDGRAKEIEQRMKDHVLSMDGAILRFTENHLFCLSNEVLGELAYEEPRTPVKWSPDSIDKPVRSARSNSSEIVLPNQRIAVNTAKESIEIYDKDRKFIYELMGHTQSINELVLLPNGWLASASDDRTVMIWTDSDRKAIKTLRGHKTGVFSMLVLKNGHLATCAQDDSIRIWNPFAWDPKDHLVRTLLGHGIEGFPLNMFKLSNDYLVTCSTEFFDAECVVRVWNPETGRLVREVPTGHSHATDLLVLSNDQVVVGFMSGVVKIICLGHNGLSLTIKCHRDVVAGLAELPNLHLQTCSKEEFKVWRLESGRLVKSMRRFVSPLETTNISHYQANLSSLEFMHYPKSF